jgi:tRNA(fMet)-specific endonuclease VapC
MISHLLDTDICIHALKGRSRALISKLQAHENNLAITDVTLFELYYGAERYDDRQKRLAIIEDFTSRLDIVPFESRAARHAGNIRATLEAKGQMIGAYDVMIAAVARSQGLALATNNLREFNRVEGLLVEKWG